MSLPPTIAKDNIELVQKIQRIDHAAQIPVMNEQMKNFSATRHVISLTTTYQSIKVLTIFRGRFTDPSVGGDAAVRIPIPDDGDDAGIPAFLGFAPTTVVNRGLGSIRALLGVGDGVSVMLDPAVCVYFVGYRQVSDEEFTSELEFFLKNYRNSRRYAITDGEILQIMANLGVAAKHESTQRSLVEQLDDRIKEQVEAVRGGANAEALINLMHQRKKLAKSQVLIDNILTPPTTSSVIPYTDAQFNGGLVQNVLPIEFIRKELAEFGIQNSPAVFDYINRNINDYMVQVINYFKRVRNNSPDLAHIEFLDQLYNKQVPPRTRPSNAISFVDWKPSDKSLLLLAPRTGNLYPMNVDANARDIDLASAGGFGRQGNLEGGI